MHQKNDYFHYFFLIKNKMKVIYILLAFLYVILSSLYTVIIKGIKINSFISFFIVTITIFTIISITNFIDYYKNPKKYNKSTYVKNSNNIFKTLLKILLLIRIPGK